MLRSWCVLLAVDLWQIALRAPGSLTAAGIAWLAGLYLLVTAGAVLVLRGLLRRSPGTTLVLVLGGGLAADAAEVALRGLPYDATWRPIGAAACAAAAFAIVAVLRARARARPARWLPVAGAAVLAVGVAGALDGPLHRRAAVAPDATDAGRSALRARPNLLLVVVDTLRADHLGCYGYRRPTSPVLDELASHAALFERAFAQSSWTKPSTASLLTGRSPTEHQTLSENARLPDAEVTIAERLRARGYRTAAMSANPWITPEYGFDQGVDDFVYVYDERFARVPLLMRVLKRFSQATDGKMRLYNRVKYLVLGELSTTARDTKLIDGALAWLAAHRDVRFFLYLHMMSPHHPYDPPPPFDRFVPDRTHAPVKNYPRKSYRFFEHGDPLPPDALADMTARYDGDILYADTELGRLLEGLDRLGLATSTALVVTADHGEELYDHENWGHGQSVYDELVHVPLILRVPGGGTPGRRVSSPVSHADVTPTLLDLAGLPAVEALAGRSLVHVTTEADRGAAGAVLSELLYQYGEARALVEADRKLVTIRDGERRTVALYDLATDPGERHPLAPSDPQVAALTVELERRVEAARHGRSVGVEAAVDDDTRTRLRGLGYAQ